MAKLSFTKLGLKPNNETVNIPFGEQFIEVKQYLPIEEKLDLITKVLELSHDSNNFSNPVKVQVYASLEIIEKYTNITFTEKQKENPTKLYDLMLGNNLIHAIIDAIPQEEYDILMKGLYNTIDSVYKYQNSVLGILDTISQDYSNLNLDASEIQKKLADPNNMELLKGIMTKLG